MHILQRRTLLSCVALLPVTLLFGCQGCSEVDQNAKKYVLIKVAHLANVNSFQPNKGNSLQYSANNGGFWAVFEVCSIDVQGSSLAGFNYDSGKYVIPWGTAEIGRSTPGLVSRSDAKGLPMPNAEVADVVNTTFEAGPGAQYLPKQLYLKPGFRFAIFLNSYPSGYKGEPMDLKYLGQPEVAAGVQEVAPDNPQQIQFYNRGVSPPIASRCP